MKKLQETSKLTNFTPRGAADSFVNSGNSPVRLPLVFDPQINGYAGVDFQRADLEEEECLSAMESMRQDGLGQFLWTLITDEWSSILRKIEKIMRWRNKHPAAWKMLAGWHIEGPFLSSESGYRGAHPAEFMMDPKPEYFVELKNRVGELPTLVTLAPERKGAMAAISTAVSLGFKVSLGHTQSSAVEVRSAMEAGATGFTHLGNGCPPMLNRAENVIWNVLDQSGLNVGLIPDGAHVSPALFRIIRRAAKDHCIYITTDAMSAAAMPPGRYSLGNMDVDVGADQVVRMPGTQQFAGSALRPMDAILRAAVMWGISPAEVWPHYSLIPGRWLGVEAAIQSGSTEDYCLMEWGRTVDIGEIEMKCQVVSGGKKMDPFTVNLPDHLR